MRPRTRPVGPFSGGVSGGSLLRVSLRRLFPRTRSSSPGSAVPFVLCRQEARFLLSTVLLVPSLFSGFSRLPPARLETQASQDLPRSQGAVLAPPSSFSAGLTGCLVFIIETFLARSFLHS